MLPPLWGPAVYLLPSCCADVLGAGGGAGAGEEGGWLLRPSSPPRADPRQEQCEVDRLTRDCYHT